MHIFDLPIEIFTIILEYLSSPDLLRCALTCKQWTTIALNLIWGKGPVELRSLLELLCPVHSIAKVSYLKFGNSVPLPDIATAISHPNWLRLNERRKQITQLSINHQFQDHDIEFILELQHACDPDHEPFFPKLLALDLYVTGESWTPYWDLLPSSLRRVKFDGQVSWTEDRNQRRREVLEFAARFLQIDYVVSIGIGELDYGIFRAVREIIHVAEFSIASWSKLSAGCPRLEHVVIGHQFSEDEEQVSSALENSVPQTLPALHTLNLSLVSNCAVALYIFLLTDMPRLDTLELNFAEATPDDTWELLSLFAAQCPYVTYLLLLDWPQPEGSAYQLPFKQVQELTINTNLDTLTSERMIELLGEALDLTYLVIYDADRVVNPAITPESFGTLTGRWKRLKYLEIGMSSRGTLDEFNPQTPVSKFEGLKALVLDPVVLKNPLVAQPLAQYLSVLCPQIPHFSVQSAQDFEWKPTFISIRGCKHMISVDVCCKCVTERKRHPRDYVSEEEQE